MKTFVKYLRKAGYILILLVAAFAVSIAGQFLPITQERYRNKKITTEQVEKKRRDD